MPKLTKNQLVAAIQAGDLTMDELREVNDALRAAWNATQRRLAQTFREGQTVAWAGRRGRMQGEVVQVNQKTLMVLVNGVRWKVTASLCTVVEG